MLAPEAVAALIHGIESELPVDEWMIDGRRVWPLLRLDLSMRLTRVWEDPGEVITTAVAGRTLLRGATTGAVDAARADRRCGGRVQPADIMVLSSSAVCVRLGDRWYDRFADALREDVAPAGRSVLTLSHRHGPLLPRAYPAVHVQSVFDRLTLLAAVRRRLRRPRVRVAGWDAMLDMLPVEARADTTIERVAASAALVEQVARWFMPIMARVRPRVAMSVAYYGPYGMGLNVAAARAGIPSVDLQHGLQGPYHLAYADWSRVPADGYDVLPAWFWCWSPQDAAVIGRWADASAAHRVVVGGNPFVTRWLQRPPEAAQAADQLVRSRIAQDKRSIQVLWSLSPDLEDDAAMERVLAAVVKTTSSVTWWVRVHPMMRERTGEVRRTLEATGTRNWVLEEAGELPLLTLLPHMRVHVTHSSSTAHEATAFGVPTVITSSYGAAFLQDLVDRGVAVVSLDADALARDLLAVAGRPPVSGGTDRPVDTLEALRRIEQ